MRRLFAGICALLLFLNSLHAKVVAIDAGTGLTDKYITAICSDQRGLLWIGTKQGLCSYDGNHFEPLDAPLQSGTGITKLLFDPQSARLWVATERGLFNVNCLTRRITDFKATDQVRMGAIVDICSIGGKLYVAANNGELATIDNDGRLIPVSGYVRQAGMRFFANSLQPHGNDAINLQPAGKTPGSLVQTKTGRLEKQPADTSGGAIYFRKTVGRLLFTAQFGAGMKIKDTASNKLLYPESSALLQHVDNVIDVWPVAPGKLFLLRKPSNLYLINLVTHRSDTIVSEAFTGRLSTSFFRDAGGVLWVGTNKGLVKVTEDGHHFAHMLVHTPPISIRSIAKDEAGNLYAGTYSGLFRLGATEPAWKSWSGMLPYAMLNMPGRYLYFVGEQPALYRVDKQSPKVETGFYLSKNLPPDGLRQAYAIASDEAGLIWIGTSYGLATYSPATNTLAAFNAAGLPANTEVRYIRLASNRHLWLGTRSGLYELDPARGIVWHISTATKPALSVNTVNYIDEDADGRLWLCTDGGGVNIIAKDRSQVAVLKKEDGLSDNTTYQMLRQSADRIWISTFNGLSTYNLRSKTFYNYYVEDGLTNNEFNHNAFLKEGSGRMLFGSINGINAFFPDSVPAHNADATLFASSITKWDNRSGALLHLHPADTSSSITLEPLDHSLTFNLALTDYQSPEAEVFLYRIKGLFDEWVTLNSQRSLRLDGLPGGHYVLEIKALDSRGRPALNVLHYHIDVAQPFYKSWWFYLALFVLASALLSAFFILRLQNIRRVQHLREQIASDLHDEVGSLLTRITMTSDNLQYSSHSDADRSTKLQKIASLSRTAASSMSDILWAIDARNDYTGNLADRMREHAEEMLAPLSLHPEFDFAVNPRMSISSQLRQQLYMIYKEAINNVVKHSTANDVRIAYHHNEQGFRLSIVNNGYVPKEKPSTKGQGLKNMHMRAEKLHAKADINGDATAGIFKVVIDGA